MSYQLGKFFEPDTESSHVIRLSDYASIPFDPLNPHYQKYLEWVAEGNTPNPPGDLPPSSANPEAQE